jgi:hypothetical protein
VILHHFTQPHEEDREELVNIPAAPAPALDVNANITGWSSKAPLRLGN